MGGGGRELVAAATSAVAGLACSAACALAPLLACSLSTLQSAVWWLGLAPCLVQKKA